MQFFIRSAPYMRAKWDERVKVNMWVLWWGEGYVVWKGGGHVINGKTEDSSMEERERERGRPEVLYSHRPHLSVRIREI